MARSAQLQADRGNPRLKFLDRYVGIPLAEALGAALWAVPGVVEHDGQRLPASYANFYIANKMVLVPTYRHVNDKRALEILQREFPDRRVIGIDSMELIWGLGSFHCISQQEPA